MELVGGLLGEDEVKNETIVVTDEIVYGNACVIVGIVFWSDRRYCVGALPITNEPTFRTLSVSDLISMTLSRPFAFSTRALLQPKGNEAVGDAKGEDRS